MHANGKLTKVLPLSQVLNIGQIVILAIAIFIVYLIMSKIKFPTFQLLAPLIVLIVLEFFYRFNIYTRSLVVEHGTTNIYD